MINSKVLIALSLLALCKPILGATLNGTVRIDKSKEGFSYIVAGKKILPEKLLNYFGELIEREGTSTPVDVYFSNGTTFDAVTNLKGIITKAGISNVRLYYFSNDTHKAVEVVFKGPALPVPISVVHE